jgi:diaminobutyrate-2-oxoglutarate transaminase
MDVFEEMESNIRSYCRAFPVVFHRGRGHHIYDVDGRQYLDFLCGAGALNYGHNPPEIVAAVIDYMRDGGIVTSLDLHTVAKQDFLATFRDVILRPRGLDYIVQFTGPTGANAIEAALKLARLVTGRANIVAFTNGYHGGSLGALAISGNRSMRSVAGADLGQVTRLPYDGYFGVNSARLLDHMLCDSSSGIDLPAAVMVELIQGEGGINVATRDWLVDLEAVARKHSCLLIVDDIQAGCGRTGKFFSFEDMCISPDIVCLSKSIGAIGLPMAIVLFGRHIDNWHAGQHTGTFRGNNLAFVAGRVALEHYWNDASFTNSLGTRIAYFDDLLLSLERRYSPARCKLKGRGFMRGLMFSNGRYATAISQECFKNGLIAETCGPSAEVLKLLPPITIDEIALSQAVSILDSAIGRVLSDPHLLPNR